MEKTTLMTEVCLPYAISRNAKDPEFLFKTLDEVSSITPLNIPKRIMLRNCGSSCALDSVLTAIFSHDHCRYVKHILKSDKKDKTANLRKALNTLYHTTTISDIKKEFKAFPHDEKFYDGGTKDAGEFLTYLFTIFQQELSCVKLFQMTDKDNKFIYSRVDRTSLPIMYVTPSVLKDCKENVTISEFLSIAEDVNDNTSIERIVKSDIVCFIVDRIASNKSINVTETLTTINKDRFYLASVVVHANGHYMCYIRRGNAWLCYDDSSSPIEKRIGERSFNLSFAFSPKYPNIKTHGVIYVYVSDLSCVDDHYLRMEQSDGSVDIGLFHETENDKASYYSTFFKNVEVCSPAIKNSINRTLYKPPKKQKGTLRVHTIKDYLRLL